MPLTHNLPDYIVERAYNQDRLLGGRVSILSQFSVTGLVAAEGYKQMEEFLTANDIAYDGNGDTLIWIGTLEPTLAKLFKTLKQK